MNSEELERSLKTEFESYLKTALAEMREQVDGLQEKLAAEVEKHKSQIESVVREFVERLAADPELDEGFQESVVEHLKLARDEGARITAEAITEAEKLDEETAAPVSYGGLRDAISEITEQDSQAEILKSLINHAAEFTPRGAFFIIKNEHFVGWRTFGKEASENDDAIREVYFPVAAETVLGESVRSLAPVESSYGAYDADTDYLDKLDFGQPDRMYAIPLTARGRGVAVLYADYGQEGTRIDLEALETLVRVAGLTVELLAATRRVKTDQEEESSVAAPAETTYDSAPEEKIEQPASTDEQTENSADEYAETDDFSTTADSSESLAEAAEQSETDEYEQDYAPSVEYSDEAAAADFESADSDKGEWETAQDNLDYSAETEEITEVTEVTETDSFEPVAVSEEEEDYPVSADDYQMPAVEDEYAAPATSDYEFEPAQTEETSVGYGNQTANAWSYNQNDYAVPADALDSSANGFAPSVADEPETVAASFEPAVETATAAPVRTRFSDRSIDLPIDVPEEERRLHNDARRFARLLISEIKLYNEQKVKEGRDSSDLYERLREAIDRSREMYDKRVQPPVAAKFDYFHYELVNTLAEGDDGKLGASYPGATA